MIKMKQRKIQKKSISELWGNFKSMTYVYLKSMRGKGTEKILKEKKFEIFPNAQVRLT